MSRYAPTRGLWRGYFRFPNNGETHIAGQAHPASSEFLAPMRISAPVLHSPTAPLPDNSIMGLFAQSGPIETGINLPMPALTDPEAIGRLCRQLPNHAAFEGLIIEVNGAELIRSLDPAMRPQDSFASTRLLSLSMMPGRSGSRLPTLATFRSSSSRSAENLSPDVPRID